MGIFPHFSAVLFCVGRGLETGRSPIKGVLLKVWRFTVSELTGQTSSIKAHDGKMEQRKENKDGKRMTEEDNGSAEEKLLEK